MALNKKYLEEIATRFLPYIAHYNVINKLTNEFLFDFRYLNSKEMGHDDLEYNYVNFITLNIDNNIITLSIKETICYKYIELIYGYKCIDLIYEIKYSILNYEKHKEDIFNTINKYLQYFYKDMSILDLVEYY